MPFANKNPYPKYHTKLVQWKKLLWTKQSRTRHSSCKLLLSNS